MASSLQTTNTDYALDGKEWVVTSPTSVARFDDAAFGHEDDDEDDGEDGGLIEVTGGQTKQLSAATERYLTDDSVQLTTDALRLPPPKAVKRECARTLRQDTVQAGHKFDLEMMVYIIEQSGERVSRDQMEPLRQALNVAENYRPITQGTNIGIERKTVEVLKVAHAAGTAPDYFKSSDAVNLPHMEHKARDQARFLLNNQRLFTPSQMDIAKEIYRHVRDESGNLILDGRKLTQVGQAIPAAGSSRSTSAGKASPNEKATKTPTTTAPPAPGRLKADGSPDMRFAANRQPTASKASAAPVPAPSSAPTAAPDQAKAKSSSQSTAATSSATSSPAKSAAGPVRADGMPDMRYASNRDAASASSSSSSASPGRPAAAPSGPVRADGNPDMRYSSNKASGSTATASPASSATGPLRADGQPDMRYASNRSSTPSTTTSSSSSNSSSASPSYSSSSSSSYSSSSSSSYAASSSSASRSSSSSAGPMKADGTPDMRYAANRR